MNMLSFPVRRAPVRRTFGRYVPARFQGEATAAVRSDIDRFFTAFAGGFVFFSVLFF